MEIERETMVRERHPRLDEIQANLVFYSGKAMEKLIERQANLSRIVNKGRTRKPYSKYTTGTLDDVFLLEEEKFDRSYICNKYCRVSDLDRAYRRALSWWKRNGHMIRKHMPKHIAEKMELVKIKHG